MCRKNTTTILQQEVLITSLLDQAVNLPGDAGLQVLVAILPLVRVSGNLRDHIGRILRKAINSPGTEQRKMAITGFTHLLKNLRLASLTNLSQSQLPSSNDSFCVSIFSQVCIFLNCKLISSIRTTTALKHWQL